MFAYVVIDYSMYYPDTKRIFASREEAERYARENSFGGCKPDVERWNLETGVRDPDYKFDEPGDKT